MVQFATENFPRFISDEKADMLREAAFHKSTEEFRALLQGLSGKEYADIAVDNILYKALETDNVDVVRAIVDAKHTDTFQYSRLILRAASELAKKCISLFLDRVANLNEQTDNIRPPGWAWGLRTPDMVSWLLDHGADVNVRSYTDVTPVTFALETCPVDAVRELFRRADIDLTKGELLHAALSRHKGHILYPGVGPFYGNDKDRVPADDIVDVLKIVLEQDGIDKLINVKQYANHVPSYRMYFFMHLGPPIRLAAERGLTDAVRLLLVHGADPTIKDNKGQTPDFYAEKWGHAETAEVLRAAMKRASSYNAGKL